MRENLISYLITDPSYYTNDIIQFEKKLEEVFKNKKVDFACYRDKKSKNTEELAEIFIKICKKYKIKQILLNTDYKLAKKLGATGVHLNSKQFDKIKEAKDLDLFVIISCHDINEIENAQKAHVNAVTYSPIFQVENKGEAKGMAKLRETIRVYEDLDIIALGGIISEKEIKEISKTRALGFASIRYFISD